MGVERRKKMAGEVQKRRELGISTAFYQKFGGKDEAIDGILLMTLKPYKP